MTCDDFRAAYLSDDLTASHRRHLVACSDCRDDQPALESARRLLADSLLWEETGSQLEERVVGLISGPASLAETPPAQRRSWRIPVAAAVVGLLVASLGVWALVRTPGADWTVPIPGTLEAPTAAGVIQGWNESTGTRVVLDIEGLAPAPPGSVYELWFTRDDVHVSAGTFTGPGEVKLWVGVSRGAFPRLWVTLEPIDGDEAPSGFTVLDTAP